MKLKQAILIEYKFLLSFFTSSGTLLQQFYPSITDAFLYIVL